MRDFDPNQKPDAPFDRAGALDEPDPMLDDPDRLLDELESIKDLLDRESGEQFAGDIPLLDDLVVDLPPQPALLDIDGIFDEHPIDDGEDIASERAPAFQFPKFTLDVAISDDPLPEPTAAIAIAAPANCPAPTAPTNSAASARPNASSATRPSVRPNYSRELLIQELVDEFIPQIEAALHERLGRLDDAALLALKNAE